MEADWRGWLAKGDSFQVQWSHSICRTTWLTTAQAALAFQGAGFKLGLVAGISRKSKPIPRTCFNLRLKAIGGFPTNIERFSGFVTHSALSFQVFHSAIISPQRRVLIPCTCVHLFQYLYKNKNNNKRVYIICICVYCIK